MPKMHNGTPSKTKRNRDADDDDVDPNQNPSLNINDYKDVNTAPASAKMKTKKPKKILYVITSLARGDWNPFGPGKWNYLQNADKHNETDMQCIWFAKYYPKTDERKPTDDQTHYNGTYQSVYDPKTGKRPLVKINDIAAWDTVAVKKFVADYYEEGNTHLVIGTHGQGDYFWIDRYTEDGGKSYHKGKAIPIRKVIKDNFAGNHYLSSVLDCCLMGELYTMKHFHRITDWVGCAEGFQWGDDDDYDATMFSAASALALSNPDVNTYNGLRLTGNHYVSKKFSPQGRADFGIYFTPNAEALLSYITENPTYHKIMQDVSNLIVSSDSTKFSKYCFSTTDPNIDPDTYDAQYLLDIWQIALDYPQDAKLQTLFRNLVYWHRGQLCGWGPTTPARYNFQLCGMSITVAHTPATVPDGDDDESSGDDDDNASSAAKKKTAKKSPKKTSPKKAASPSTKNTTKKSPSEKTSPKKKTRRH